MFNLILGEMPRIDACSWAIVFAAVISTVKPEPYDLPMYCLFVKICPRSCTTTEKTELTTLDPSLSSGTLSP